MSELTSVRHSISKMRKRKTFDEQEKVIVYSDLSEDLDELYAPHIVGGRIANNNIRPRRVPRELANLGNNPQCATRLRSGRN